MLDLEAINEVEKTLTIAVPINPAVYYKNFDNENDDDVEYLRSLMIWRLVEVSFP